MKITKRQLRKIIKEAFPVKGKAVGNFIKKGRAGRKLTMQGREYIDLGKGHWQGPDGEKLNWVQLSSMASALGDEMVRIDNNPRISETKITKNQLRRIIKEEKAHLLKEIGDQPIPRAPGVEVYRISMVVAVEEGSVDAIQGSIEDGMEFNEEDGEGILEYDIRPETSEYFNKPPRRGNY